MESAGINDVIKQMLDVERQAQELASQAEQKAHVVTAQAGEQARKIVEDARHAATQESSGILKEVLARAQRERDERIAQEMQADEHVVERSKPKIEEAARFIVCRIIASED